MSKAYRFFGDHLRDKFGCRVLKLPINAGMSCPNRDGTLSSEGCIFCSTDGSAAPATYCGGDICAQMNNAKSRFKRIEEETKFIAYFQAFTNTYASINKLKELYNAAISVSDIVGLMIGTRPDCLNDDVLNLISEYKKDDFELWVEIGMQSAFNKSLNFLNRGHSYEDTVDAVHRAAKLGLNTCLHVILGIPGETWDDMMETALHTASLPINGIKFHHMHVIRGTKLEEMYNTESISMLSMQEYVSVLCDFIERLRPETLIHRLMGDRNKKTLAAPLWGQHKGTVQKAIDDEFERRGSYQGFLYTD